MIDFSSLPSSEAGQVEEALSLVDGVYFTYIENMDKRKLFNSINKRLMALETSLEVNREELCSIQEDTKGNCAIKK